MKTLLKKCQFRANSFSLLHLPENGLEKNHIHLAGYLFSSNFLSRSSFFFCSFLLCCSFIYLFFWEISFSTHKLFRNSFTVLWLLLLVYSVADHNFFFSVYSPFIPLFPFLFHFYFVFARDRWQYLQPTCRRVECMVDAVAWVLPTMAGESKR